MTASPIWTQTWLTASDGVQLALYSAGPEDAPAVVLVHGYPDDHSVWDSVAADLATDLRVVAYDVRGAGASDVPGARAAYRVEQLADDLARVGATTGDAPVHLLAHDWGSVQAWRAVTGEDARRRYASLTSISGPDQAYAAAWLTEALRTNRAAALRQLASSWYVAMFLLPVVPDVLWASGLGQRLLPGSAPARSIADAVHGLNLYRANVSARSPRTPRPCSIPVQVLAPRHDAYLTHALVTQAPQPHVRDLRAARIEGGHWGFVAHPERVVEPVRAFVGELVEG